MSTLGTREDNIQIGNVITSNYGLTISFIELISWGYTTNCFYIKTIKGDFVARVSDFSEEKVQDIKRDMLISSLLGSEFLLPTFLKTTNEEDLVTFMDLDNKKRLLRISDHKEGVMPFALDEELLVKITEYLYTLHNTVPVTTLNQLRDSGLVPSVPSPRQVLLHGDLTPSNVLIANGDIVRVVDFEMARFGPPEYDLAKTALFSWFYLNKKDFAEIAEIVTRAYVKDLNIKLFNDYAKTHLNTHLVNTLNHEGSYQNPADFQRDVTFTKSMLLRLLS